MSDSSSSSTSSNGKGRKRRVSLATGGSKRFVYTSRDALYAAARGLSCSKKHPSCEMGQAHSFTRRVFFLDRWMQFRLTMEDPSEAFPCDLLIDINLYHCLFTSKHSYVKPQSVLSLIIHTGTLLA